jgi:hypothetical protein
MARKRIRDATYKREYKRRYASKWRNRFPERVRANDRRYYWKHREKINAARRGKYSEAKRRYHEKYRKRHRLKYLEYGRRRYRAKRAELLAYQQKRRRRQQEAAAGRPRPPHCEVCGRKSKARREIAFDHCHKTGRFRGWLCSGCNFAIGNADEDPTILRKLAEYLERTQ